MLAASIQQIDKQPTVQIYYHT